MTFTNNNIYHHLQTFTNISAITFTIDFYQLYLPAFTENLPFISAIIFTKESQVPIEGMYLHYVCRAGTLVYVHHFLLEVDLANEFMKKN